MVIYTYVSLPFYYQFPTFNPIFNPPQSAPIFIMSIIFNALPLPPISEFGEPFYRSAKQAIEAINIYAQPQGFAVSKRSTEPNRVQIQYARSRAYKAQK